MKTPAQHVATLEWDKGTPKMEAMVRRAQIEAYSEGYREGQGLLMGIAEATAERIRLGDDPPSMGLTPKPKK